MEYIITHLFAQIPGHVRAFTGWFTLTLIINALLLSLLETTLFPIPRVVGFPLGFLLIGIGYFLGEQATHLNQEEHRRMPPTIIERFQFRHRILAIIGALIFAHCGVIIIWAAFTK